MGNKGQPEQRGRTLGSLDRVPLDVAVRWIDGHTRPLDSEVTRIADAVGRVLAEPAVAVADAPPFDRATIDGIALRAEETVGASIYSPLGFRLAPAGETLPPSGAARVNAGERVPSGADAIVSLEHASVDVAGAYEIVEPVASGSQVERRGSHVARGATLLAAGRQLRPYDIGLMVSAGIAHMPVIRRPEVRGLLTGRGLTEPDGPSSVGGVYDADGPLLRALVERDGGILTDFRRIDRDGKALRDALAAPGPNIVLVAGSTGNGPDDYAAAALAQAGELAIHGVALCPGESAGVGRVGAGTYVFLLPGTPAACLWAYEFFAGRAIRRLAGRSPALPFRSMEMRTSRKIVSSIGMTEIYPVRCGNNDSVEPIASFAEAGLMAAARADGFVIIPEGSEGFSEGATVTTYLYEQQDRLPGPISEATGSRR